MWRANGPVGGTVIGVCLVPPLPRLVDGPQLEQLRMQRDWAWTWELQEPLPLLLLVPPLVAAVLLLRGFPAFWRWNRAASVAVTAALGGLVLLGLLLSGVDWKMRRTSQRRVAHLEDAGRFDRAAIVGRGNQSFRGSLRAVPRGGSRWVHVSEPFDYPPCDWPFGVRKTEGAPRYLVVDSRARVTALLDLTRPAGEEWSIVSELPPLADFRREFGPDLTAVALWE